MTAVAQRSAAPSKLGYRPALDGLRAISVLAVVMYHGDVSWLPGGFLGVEVFFVVSGFLITSLMVEERILTKTVDLKQFWIRRARRLLPAMYLLLAVVSVAALLVWRDASGRMAGDVIAALTYVSNWWQIHLNDSYFAAAGRPPLLKHLWSLAVEEQFYLIFPPLFALAWVRFGRRRTRTGLIVLALASAIEMAILYTPGKDPSRVYFGTDTRACGMLLGAALAVSWAPWRSNGRAAKSATNALDVAGVAGLGLILLFITQVNEFDSFIYRGGFLLLDLLCLVVIAVMVHPAARSSKLLAVAPLVWIGKRSYSIYLWHWPIFQVTRPDIDIPLSGLPLLVLRLGLTVGAAELSYRYVEQPLRKGALSAWWRNLQSADGADRQLLARKGLAVATTFSVLVGVIGLGLWAAAASPDRTRLETAAIAESGLVPSANPNDDPSAPDAGVATSTTAAPTTTSTIVTTTSLGASATVAPVPTTAAIVQTATNAVAVGDSVLLGAKGALLSAMPGIRIDAKVARQFNSLLSVASWYVSQGYVQGPLVVHLGTNGTFTDGDLDQLVKAAGDRKLILVNAKVNRPWQDLVNGRIQSASERHPGITVIDWHSEASAHPEWFVGDGTHLRPAGAAALADLIRQAL